MAGQPGASFRGSLERAYRRACRIGAPEVGTDLVLYGAAMYVHFLDGRLPMNPWDSAWRPVRNGTTGLTDPRPPDPAAWETDFAEEVAFEAAAVLRAAAFRGSDTVRARAARKGVPASLPEFSPAVRFVVHEAIREDRIDVPAWGVQGRLTEDGRRMREVAR